MDLLNIKAELKQTSVGRLFCLKTAKQHSQPSRAVLVVPPFAEEMNKSRKMMSLLLAEVASDNTCAYLFDLYGTGDSEGDFEQATWDIWRTNLADMLEFVSTQTGIEQVSIVAIRTGALLVNSILADENALRYKISSVHYWNPIFNASLFTNQFLRLKLAANMMRNNGPKVGVKELRQQLQDEGILEVAGYTLNKSLVEGMEAATISLHSSLSKIKLHFYELSSLDQITPGLMKKIAEVSDCPEHCSTHVIKGPQFWSTQEISLCKPLLSLTQKQLFVE